MSLFQEFTEHAAGTALRQYTVYENGAYQNGSIHGGHTVSDLYSASKSFTSIAIGMLCDRGLLSLDDTIYDIFRDEYPYMDARWREVSVACVLYQKTGINGMFLDVDSEDASSYGTDDYLEYVLRHPFRYAPDTTFAYSDSNFYLCARVAGKRAGEPVQNFLGRELFQPLRMQSWAWAACPRGHAMGGTGLFMRTIDMAKAGVMLLQEGVWEGKRYLSSAYIENAVLPHSPMADGVHFYGLGFWGRMGSRRYTASGAFDQVIFIDPDHQTVCAWHAYDPAGADAPLTDWLYRR